MFIIIFIIWILIAGYKLQYPAFSVQELSYLPNFLLANMTIDSFWVIRFISVIATGIWVAALARKYSYKKIIILITVLNSVFLYAAAHEFNLLISIFFILSAAIISRMKKVSYLISILLLIFLFIYKPEYSGEFFRQKLDSILHIFDFSYLFFQMETESYLKIPHTGYFSLVAVPFIGYGFLQARHQKKMWVQLVWAILFFVLTPDTQIVFSGIGFFIIFMDLILWSLDRLQNKYIYSIILCVSFVSVAYFFDLYFNHYQLKIGNSRNHAEIVLVDYMQKHADKKYYSFHNPIVATLIKRYTEVGKKVNIVFIKQADLKNQLSKCITQDREVCVVSKEVYESEYIKEKVIRIEDSSAGITYLLL